MISFVKRIGGLAITAGLLALGIQFCSWYYPGIVESLTEPGCLVKGNVSIESGTRIYHIVGMEDYANTKISPEKGERWFCTEEEAMTAGWVRAPR